MKNKFKTYKQYLTYLTSQGNVESDMIEKLLDARLLVKEKVVTVEGYEAIGFRVMTEQEFNASEIKKRGVFERVMKRIKGDKQR